MAAVADLWKIVFNYQIGSGDEIGSVSHHARWPFGAASADGLAQHGRDSWLSAWGSVGPTLFPTGVKYSDCSAYSLAPAPPYHATGKGVAPFAPSGAGALVGIGAASLPWECAFCITLNAFATGVFTLRKARQRGRMYLGPWNVSLPQGEGGLMGPESTTQIVGIMRDYFEAFNDLVVGEQARAVVFSRGGTSGPGSAAVNDIVSVQADTKFDSQRRRERQQAAGVTVIKSADLSP